MGNFITTNYEVCRGVVDNIASQVHQADFAPNSCLVDECDLKSVLYNMYLGNMCLCLFAYGMYGRLGVEICLLK